MFLLALSNLRAVLKCWMLFLHPQSISAHKQIHNRREIATLNCLNTKNELSGNGNQATWAVSTQSVFKSNLQD